MSWHTEARSRLEEILRERMISQTELGRAIGFDSSNMSRLVAGKRPISRAALLPIATALGCEPEVLRAPIGAPVPPWVDLAAVEPPPDFTRRLKAIMSILGIESME